MDHPVKLIVGDDLQRSRATVFLRLLLAIPHLLWLVAWGVAVVGAVLVDWLVLLASGSPWAAGHAFVARYLRYAIQVSAYVCLLADPYPRFTGAAAYPVDVQLPPPAPQNRWTVLVRAPLAIPALLIGTMLVSGVWSAESPDSAESAGGLLATVAFLGWFAALALGRMPRGLRDAGAYGLAYAAQLSAYLLLLTDRYPNSDPLAAVPGLAADEHPIRLAVEDDLRRSRLTTLVRLALAIPHVVWLMLWGIGALLAMVANWFAVLVSGRSPAGLHEFLAAYLRYMTHVYAYVGLVANPYPGFAGEAGAYPVDLVVDEPQRQDRLTVAFRLPLAIPAIAISGAYAGLGFVAAVLGWFAVLVRGEMPRGLRNAAALALRYQAQLYGYLFVLTDRYPYSGPVAAAPAAEPEPVTYLPPDAYATTA
jgi:hypothetical protein